MVGNLYKDGLTSEDCQCLKKAIEILAGELNNETDPLLKKLSQILIVKMMRYDGQEIDRGNFTKFMGEFSAEAPRWYDEVVCGFIKQ